MKKSRQTSSKKMSKGKEEEGIEMKMKTKILKNLKGIPGIKNIPERIKTKNNLSLKNLSKEKSKK